MKASRLTISVPPLGRSRRFVRSAAGFIATRTFGASPGVRMSWSEKWIWKPETPGSEPAGARISAGKSGSVERSLPSSAVSLVKRDPVSCMPSPESPAKRMIDAVDLLDGLGHRDEASSGLRRWSESERASRARARSRGGRRWCSEARSVATRQTKPPCRNAQP